MFEKMKNMFSGKKTQKVETKLSEKEEATKNGKPWVKVLDTNCLLYTSPSPRDS